MKNSGAIISRAAVALLAVCGVAAAAPSQFNFATYSSNNYSSFASPTSNGVNFTATAWSTPNTSTALSSTNTTIGIYNGYGLGVCSPGDNPCSTPEHQIDNHNYLEFVLFSFNTAVDLNSLVLENFGTSGGPVDMDISYWTKNSATSNAGYTISTLASSGGFSAQQNVDYSGTASTTTDSFTTVNGIRSLLVGARVNGDQNLDFFKIVSLNVTASPTATPEPATFVLSGAALLGLAMWTRRRRAGAQLR